jgi:hypothetical protein
MISKQKKVAEHMIEAVGYLIGVAGAWRLTRVVVGLDQVRSELSTVVSNLSNDDDEDRKMPVQ